MSTETIEHVTQRMVPAASAPRPASTAPSSVFTLGQLTQGSKPIPAKKTSPAERALSAFSQGDLSVAELAAGLGCTQSRARQIAADLVRAGEIHELRRDGLRIIYAAGAKPSSAITVPRSKTKPIDEPRAEAPCTRALTPVQPIVRPETQAQPLCLGLYSSGEIVIERGAEAMRLTPQQARQLVDWALLADLSLPA